jgi:hypothetical protein
MNITMDVALAWAAKTKVHNAGTRKGQRLLSGSNPDYIRQTVALIG